MGIKENINKLIETTNAFDVDTALSLFADKAVIDDVSVGEKFKGKKGVREYLEKFFVGYKTVTRIDSIETIGKLKANVKVDFTGNFGHEKGGLDFTFASNGLILAINAYLE